LVCQFMERNEIEGVGNRVLKRIFEPEREKET
jgi:hypothetical protein